MTEQTTPIINQAELLIQQGKLREARLLLVGYLKGNPTSASAWWTLGQAVEEESQVVDCLERALRFDPGHEQARARLDEIKNPPLPTPDSYLQEMQADVSPGASFEDDLPQTEGPSAKQEMPVDVVPAPVTWNIPAATAPSEAPPSIPIESNTPPEVPMQELLFSANSPVPPQEGEFDLFAPGAFEEQNTQASAALSQSEAARPWVEQLVQTLNSAGEPETPVQETANVPTWALPPEPLSPQESTSREEKPARNRMSAVETILLIILILLVLAVGGYFALSLLGII